MSRGTAVLAFVTLVLGVSPLLISQLRRLDGDRAAGRRTVATLIGATGTRVAYSLLVVSAYVILPMAWAVGAVDTAGLAPFVTAPLAMHLGDVVSHRSGEALKGAMRESLLLLAAFAGILALALYASA